AGSFRTAFASDGESLRTPQSILRYSVTDGVDPAWAVKGYLDDAVYASTLAIQRNGRVLAGGRFSELAGGIQTNLARVLPDGSMDFGLRAEPNGAVHAILNRAATGIWDSTRRHVAWLTAAGRDRPGVDYARLSELSGRIH